MTSTQTHEEKTEPISANLLIAIIGLLLYVTWALLSCFWMLQSNVDAIGYLITPAETLWFFIGFPLGFVLLAFLGKKPNFNPFNVRWLLIVAVAALVLPAIDLLTATMHVFVPLLNCLAFFLAGMAAAQIQTCWLDAFSRFNITKLGVHLGSSVLMGAILFFLITSMPAIVQPIAAALCILGSIGLVAYTSKTAPENTVRAPLESTDTKWEFVREIEPSLFMFGIIFALTFFYLNRVDSVQLLIGLGGLAIGGVIAMLLPLFKVTSNITVYQRVTVIVTVLACVSMPFATPEIRLVLSLLVAACCSFFIIANSVFLIRKMCSHRRVPVFRVIPKRLFVLSAGFATGWLIAVITYSIPGVPHDALGYVRLVIAVVLVAIVMFFLPVEHHHDARDGGPSIPVAQGNAPISATAAAAQPKPVVNDNAAAPANGAPITATPGVVLTETQLFEARCAAIVKLYQLSPREADILPYLAKGRNNAYLQEKFVISPHTAKSHIYNIYRKLDIHSQQKLMDFVEEFPLDEEQTRI